MQKGDVYESPAPLWWPYTVKPDTRFQFQDMYGFPVEGNVADWNAMNMVRERVRQQEKVWWAMEASKGANWYLKTYNPSLRFSSLVNTITLKRLIRKGIPP